MYECDLDNLSPKISFLTKIQWTRMHSSRMRTDRTLTVFRCLVQPPPPRKIGDPLKNWRLPEKLETPRTRPPPPREQNDRQV